MGWSPEDIRREGRGNPTIQHAVCWPRIPSTHPKDSNQSLRLGLPNFPLQSHSFRLSSCWQATPTLLARATPPSVLHSSQGCGGGVEKALTHSQGPGTPDLCTQHITPMTLWGKGVTSLSREVYKQDRACSQQDLGRKGSGGLH